MRLPTSKIYRAFPELDRFRDTECEDFIRRAEKARPLEVVGMVVGIVAALVAFVPGTFILFFGLSRLLERSVPFLRTWDAWLGVQMLGLLAMLTTVVCLTVLLPRDWWLRRAITSRILTTNCLGCGYSLLGLDVREGAVQCPECGERCRLAERGLTPADMLAGSPSLCSPQAHAKPSPLDTPRTEGAVNNPSA